MKPVGAGHFERNRSQNFKVAPAPPKKGNINGEKNTLKFRKPKTKPLEKSFSFSFYMSRLNTITSTGRKGLFCIKNKLSCQPCSETLLVDNCFLNQGCPPPPTTITIVKAGVLKVRTCFRTYRIHPVHHSSLLPFIRILEGSFVLRQTLNSL